MQCGRRSTLIHCLAGASEPMKAAKFAATAAAMQSRLLLLLLLPLPLLLLLCACIDSKSTPIAFRFSRLLARLQRAHLRAACPNRLRIKLSSGARLPAKRTTNQCCRSAACSSVHCVRRARAAHARTHAHNKPQNAQLGQQHRFGVRLHCSSPLGLAGVARAAGGGYDENRVQTWKQ